MTSPCTEWEGVVGELFKLTYIHQESLKELGLLKWSPQGGKPPEKSDLSADSFKILF